MFKDKVSAAIDLLIQTGVGGVLDPKIPVDKDDPSSLSVLDVLRLKYPPAKPATAAALIHHDNSAPPKVHVHCTPHCV